VIEDWDDAYANGAHIESAADYPPKWARLAEQFRQSALLASIWTDFGLKTSLHQAQGQHHFNVIDGLYDPQSVLARALLG
jgi:hypothetical protein